MLPNATSYASSTASYATIPTKRYHVHRIHVNRPRCVLLIIIISREFFVRVAFEYATKLLYAYIFIPVIRMVYIVSLYCNMIVTVLQGRIIMKYDV